MPGSQLSHSSPVKFLEYKKTKSRRSGFFVVGVLCALRMCTLGIENLDVLVMIYKNWPNDPKDGCMFPRGNIAKYFNTKPNLLDAH